MRKNLFATSLIAIGLCITQIASAQIPVVSKAVKALPKPILGLKVGGNFNKLSTSGSELANDYKPSFLPGVFAGLEKGDWGIRVEGIINFAKYDYTFKDVNNNPLTSGTFKNIYLDIPIMLEYKVIHRVWLQGGIQFSRTLSVSSVGNGNYAALSNPKDYFQTNSYSGVLGAELRLPVHLVLGARYILGFTDLTTGSVSSQFSNAKTAWTARTAQIYVGFRFL